jgi:RNA polymerase sigma factor (sigma-70 family)
LSSTNIQSYVVSQQRLFREGLCQSLTSQPDISVIGSSEDSRDVFATIDTQPPQVFIVDLDGDTDTNLELARKLRQRAPSIAVVMLTGQTQDEELFRALKAQAAAYISKDISGEQLADTIRQVANGLHPINECLTTRPNIAEQVLREFQEYSLRDEAEELLSPLTPRETEILKYIAEGLLNKQIANVLGISEQTIKNHVTSILRKLNANARTEAVVLALKQGLISLD